MSTDEGSRPPSRTAGADELGCASLKDQRDMSADEGGYPPSPTAGVHDERDAHGLASGKRERARRLRTLAYPCAALCSAALYLHSATSSFPSGMREPPMRAPFRRAGARRDRTRTRRSSPNPSGFVRVRRHEIVRAWCTYVETEYGLGSIRVQYR
jgi:hypothetical protein